MSSSLPPQTRRATPNATTANSERKFTASTVIFEAAAADAGTLDDANAVRHQLVQSIKNSGLSRAVIADRMSHLLGKTVTEKMLNAFTADRDDRRWPAEYDRAFCAATGDMSLIEDRARSAGLIVITEEEKVLLDFGRAYIEQKKLAAEREALEAKAMGVQS